MDFSVKAELEKLARHRLGRAKEAFAEGETPSDKKRFHGRGEPLLLRGLLCGSVPFGAARTGLIQTQRCDLSVPEAFRQARTDYDG